VAETAIVYINIVAFKGNEKDLLTKWWKEDE